MYCCERNNNGSDDDDDDADQWNAFNFFLFFVSPQSLMIPRMVSLSFFRMSTPKRTE